MTVACILTYQAYIRRSAAIIYMYRKHKSWKIYIYICSTLHQQPIYFLRLLLASSQTIIVYGLLYHIVNNCYILLYIRIEKKRSIIFKKKVYKKQLEKRNFCARILHSIPRSDE